MKGLLAASKSVLNEFFNLHLVCLYGIDVENSKNPEQVSLFLRNTNKNSN